MNKIKYIIIVFAVCFMDSIYPQDQRAMWVWNNANQVNIIIDDYNDYRKNLFEFCRAPHGDSTKGISVLFFSCRQAVYSNSDNLRGFLSAATDSGMTIEYLDGAPHWATYDKATGYERINKVIEFNDSSQTPEEKIRGIQFDVEPYLLRENRGYQPPYWDTDRMEVWEQFITFLDSCQALVNNSNSDLYFGVAIPRWYENHVGVDELKRLQDIVDYVAIMDYNEKSSVIIRDAENEVKHAEELGKKVWIGVETKEVSPETVSFAEEGVEYMEEQLDTVYQAYKSSSVFNGFAIHSYRYYRVLFYSLVSVEKDEPPVNKAYKLEQNYPNPFNPTTAIDFFLSKTSRVSLKIYTMLGENVSTLFDQTLGAGWHQAKFDGGGLASGIYFYELKGDEFLEVNKMILGK